MSSLIIGSDNNVILTTNESTNLTIGTSENPPVIIVSSNNSTLIADNLVTTVIVETDQNPSVITNTSVGPQGLSAYLVAVSNGFIGTEQEWVESLYGNPKDLVVTKGVNELATLTVDFSNKLNISQNISSVVSITSDPNLTIENISFSNKTIMFDVYGGVLNSGYKLTMTVNTVSPVSTVLASIYLLNI